MIKQGIIVLIAAVSMTACTAKYQCKLGNDCIGVQEVYGAATENAGNKETLTPDLDKAGKPFKNNGKKTSSGKGVTELGLQSFEPYAGGAMTEKPVYQPPRPLRIWIAPWQSQLDSETQPEPVLMSGQFMYATIPGSWTMGELRDDGGLSKMLILAPLDKEKEKIVPNRIQPKQAVFELPGNK